MTNVHEAKPSVVIIGGGIMGVTTGYRLALNGYRDVTVIEKANFSAEYCSHGNAGMVPGDRFIEQTYTKHIHSKSNFRQMFESLLNHIPFVNKLDQNNSVFLDPRFFFDLKCYHWGILHLKNMMNGYFQNQNYIDQTRQLKSKFLDFCHNEMNETLCVKNNQHSIVQQYLKQYGFQVYKQHFNVYLNDQGTFGHLKHLIQTSSASNNIKNIENNSNTNTNSNVARNTFVPNRKEFIRYTFKDAAIGGMIEEYPNTIVANCAHFAKILTRVCIDEYGIKFRFNTKVSKILIDNKSNSENNDKKNKIVGVLTHNGELIGCDAVIVCAGIMTNQLIQNQVFQYNSSNCSKIKKMPFIPIVPLQGMSLTFKCSNYNYPNGMCVFNPNHDHLSRLNDNVMRVTAFGYLRSLSFCIKQWEKWSGINDSSVTDLKQCMKCDYITSNTNKMTLFESKLAKLFTNSVEKFYLPLYQISEKDWNDRVLWTNYRPLTPDRVPIVSKIDKIDGLFVNGLCSLCFGIIIIIIYNGYIIFFFVMFFLCVFVINTLYIAGQGTLGWHYSLGCAKMIAKLIDADNDREDNWTATEKGFARILALDRFTKFAQY